MTAKQATGLQAPDGSYYVTLSDGAGNLAPASSGGGGVVTNAGTFAVQNTAATPAGTNVIGHVITDATSVTAAEQSGTWTIQPGNTANTTAWKVDGSAVTQPVSIATAPVLVAGSALIGKVGLDQTTVGTTNAISLAQLGANTIATGNGTSSTGTLRVAIASDNTANTNAFLTTPKKPTAGTQSTVAGSASSGTILASNAARLGATVYNDSTAILYLSNSATTASTTVYSIQLSPGSYYEVPFGYTGQLTGIWASATGNARVSELA